MELLFSIIVRTEINLRAIGYVTRCGKELIPEPAHSRNQAIRRRNNILLVVAAVLFTFGGTIIEGVLILMPFLTVYVGLDSMELLIVTIFFGVLPVLGGIYVMWRWWQSGC